MRLFISIQLNEDFRETLLDLQDSMRELGVQGNYTPEENLHLTLAFLGEYPDPEPVLDVLEGLTFRPFPITLGQTGSFDRLWWAGLEDSPELERLVRKLRRRLADAGIPYDRKKFRPHITLIRKPSSPQPIPAAALIRPIPFTEMTVDHISLMRSERGKRGMIYTEIT